MNLPLVFDAHLDLALNALEWNRDLRQPLDVIRQAESRLTDKPDRGHGTVCLPEMHRGRVGVCVATLLARVEHDAYSPVFGWRSQEQAWAMTQGQLAWYCAMHDAGRMRQIRCAKDLDAHLLDWPEVAEAAPAGRQPPVGFILSLEGADSLVSLSHLERAWAAGLRAIGPAHYGPGVYAQGTSTTGPFSQRGLDLLRECDRLGMILDVTHLSDESFWQALDVYSGPIWASHHNSRTLAPHQRQLSDEMFLALVERHAVVGLAFDAWMVVPDWKRGVSTPLSEGVTLEKWADHLDHFCQLAGNARHVGIGSDLDGCFGTEQTPQEVQSIADLQKLPEVFRRRGYSEAQISGILHGNFLRFLRRHWE
jgi:membrane dipeptidase